MAEYIDKNIIVTEIETLISEVNPTRDKVGIIGCTNVVKYFQKLLSFIDTLEVKEVEEEPYVMGKTGKFTTTTK